MGTSRRHGGRAAPATPSAPATLVIVGASARALACSATRAGWRVHAADLFGDVDLRAVAVQAQRVAGEGSYPHGLVAAIGGFPSGPVAYTGALENHPDVIEQLAAVRPLAGATSAAVRLVRDPAWLGGLAAAAGLVVPDTHDDPAGLPLDGSFLVKPRRSAGGRGIVRWDDHAGHRPPREHVWQRFVRGTLWAAAIVIDRAGGRLLGASRQLVGRPWCHARPFAYCGSVDVPPAILPAPLHHHFARLAAALAAAAEPVGLRGLVGADLVVDRSGHVHLIEINPRPTASMELVERAGGGSIAALHVAACGLPVPDPPSSPPAAGPRAIWSKAVLFAADEMVVDERLPAVCGATDVRTGWPLAADLPPAGSLIRRGGPVLTLFATGSTPRRSLAALQRRVAFVRRRLSARQAAER